MPYICLKCLKPCGLAVIRACKNGPIVYQQSKCCGSPTREVQP